LQLVELDAIHSFMECEESLVGTYSRVLKEVLLTMESTCMIRCGERRVPYQWEEEPNRGWTVIEDVVGDGPGCDKLETTTYDRRRYG
jgi:hypothetical protein